MVRRMLTGVHFDKKRGVQATPIAIVNQMIDANLEFAIQQRGYASKTRKSLTLAIWDTSVSPSTVKMAGAVWKIAMDNIKQAHARGNSGIGIDTFFSSRLDKGHIAARKPAPAKSVPQNPQVNDLVTSVAKTTLFSQRQRETPVQAQDAWRETEMIVQILGIWHESGGPPEGWTDEVLKEKKLPTSADAPASSTTPAPGAPAASTNAPTASTNAPAQHAPAPAQHAPAPAQHAPAPAQSQRAPMPSQMQPSPGQYPNAPPNRPPNLGGPNAPPSRPPNWGGPGAPPGPTWSQQQQQQQQQRPPPHNQNRGSGSYGPQQQRQQEPSYNYGGEHEDYYDDGPRGHPQQQQRPGPTWQQQHRQEPSYEYGRDYDDYYDSGPRGQPQQQQHRGRTWPQQQPPRGGQGYYGYNN
ncbi:hypothetical protein CABS02_10915 [Colletotrichum abscissum]|uniref:Uncharacterized protein n=1 Tax=Colletotrichum abscissum TaxID=1671311 RepID=A0A9Q0B0R3_9PEZI|nr:hypothetical protein CABS02_10915 [Colletotrichum abscissum]